MKNIPPVAVHAEVANIFSNAILVHMSQTPFDEYGRLASELNNFTELAGRYRFQKEAEKYLLYYLLEKMSLSPQDDLLEIGCGAGNLLIPLSFFVHSATGIDHPNLLARIKNRVPKDSDSLTLIPGNFLSTEVPGTFSRIVIYSVIQYLRDADEMLAFIRKATDLLRPGGKMLIGDIPNRDIKDRFLNSEQGKDFSATWQEQVAANQKEGRLEHQSPMTDGPLVAIDDALVEKVLEMLQELHVRAQREIGRAHV